MSFIDKKSGTKTTLRAGDFIHFERKGKLLSITRDSSSILPNVINEHDDKMLLEIPDDITSVMFIVTLMANAAGLTVGACQHDENYFQFNIVLEE